MKLKLINRRVMVSALKINLAAIIATKAIIGETLVDEITEKVSEAETIVVDSVEEEEEVVLEGVLVVKIMKVKMRVRGIIRKSVLKVREEVVTKILSMMEVEEVEVVLETEEDGDLGTEEVADSEEIEAEVDIIIEVVEDLIIEAVDSIRAVVVLAIEEEVVLISHLVQMEAINHKIRE